MPPSARPLSAICAARAASPAGPFARPRAARRAAPSAFDPARFRRLRPGWSAAAHADEGAAPPRPASRLRRAALAALLALAPSVADATSWRLDSDGVTWTDGSVAGETIHAFIDIDAYWTGADAAHALTLAAGTWTVTLNDWGWYDAWNAWSGVVEGCDADGANCAKGWLTEFVLEFDTLGQVWAGGDGRYATREQAIQGFEPMVFTLLEAETVRFYNGDWHPWDNAGGVSLELSMAQLQFEEGTGALTSEIPLPGALPLAAAGAAALWAVGRRRKG